MIDQHPAVAFLHGAHQHAAVLAHQGLGEPHDRLPAPLPDSAVRAARMNYTPVHPSALLRRIEVGREILAEHEPSAQYSGECGTCLSDRSSWSEMWIGDDWPCRTVLLLAKAWGWEERC